MHTNVFIVLSLSACMIFSCRPDEGIKSLAYVDPLIGTQGAGTQYGGMMPMAGVPFGSIDPGETNNLADTKPALCEELTRLALEWREGIEETWQTEFAANYTVT